MTEDELKAIDERIVVRGGERIYLGDGLHEAMNDICALLAEVRRLQGSAAITTMLTQRLRDFMHGC